MLRDRIDRQPSNWQPDTTETNRMGLALIGRTGHALPHVAAINSILTSAVGGTAQPDGLPQTRIRIRFRVRENHRGGLTRRPEPPPAPSRLRRSPPGRTQTPPAQS
jgi:hypothetical protein